MSFSVLLDTSFFIRLLTKSDTLHASARGYFQYFIDEDCTMKISTISVAEYCVRGERTDLPFKHLEIVPFNIDHAEQTGLFADILFKDKKIKKDKLLPRPLIPNDSKLFAQAHLDPDIEHYVTSDVRSERTIDTLKQATKVHFNFVNIETPYHETFGELPL